MNNTLKIVLLIIGVALVGYGLYSLLIEGPLNVQVQGDHTQSYAMIGLGILSLIGGIAFNKR